MVVLNKQGYINKAENLLEQWDTYQTLSTYPTKKQKNKLSNLLKRTKGDGSFGDITYNRIYLKWVGPLKVYGLPKIYKKDTILKPIVSTRGAVTCVVAKELTRVLRPW